MTRTGAAVVVWYDDNGILLARRMTRGGSLGSLHTIAPETPPPFRTAGIGVDAAGVATIVWNRRVTAPSGTYLNSPIQARRLTSSGELGPILDLHPGLPETGFGYFPQVTVAPFGQAIVVWRNDIATDDCTGRYGNDCRQGLRAVTISPGGVLGPVLEIARPYGSEAVDLTADANGDTTIAWGAEARRIRADGFLGPVLRGSPNFVSRPSVGVDQGGNATIVWGSGEVRRIQADQTLGPLWKLPSPKCVPFLEAQVAVDPSGGATVAWLRPAPPSSPCGDEVSVPYQVQARRITRGGKLGATHTLASVAEGQTPGVAGFAPDYDLSGLSLVADERRVVTATWYKVRPVTLHEADPVGSIKFARYLPRRR